MIILKDANEAKIRRKMYIQNLTFPTYIALMQDYVPPSTGQAFLRK